MRRFAAIPVLLSLGPAVFTAPFLHLHRHEDTDHFVKAHRTQALVTHTHVSRCAGAGHAGTVVLTAGQDDDDAVFLNWFLDDPHPAPSLAFVLVEVPVVPDPEPSGSWTDVPTHRAHDPPLVCSLRPRSPPTPRVSSLGA